MSWPFSLQQSPYIEQYATVRLKNPMFFKNRLILKAYFKKCFLFAWCIDRVDIFTYTKLGEFIVFFAHYAV